MLGKGIQICVAVAGLITLACSSSSPTAQQDADAGQEEIKEIAGADGKVDQVQSVEILDIAEEVPDLGEPDPCTPPTATTGCTCGSHTDCQSGWCLFHLGEKVCTDTCIEDCPEGV